MDPLSVFTLIVAAVGVYWISIRLHPYTYCRRCSGGGKNAGSSRKRFGSCGACKGTGRTERLGTRLFFRRK